MKIKTTLTALTVGAGLLTSSANAQIVFTGFDADSEQFSFFSVSDIADTTTIFFTDDEWNGSAFVDNNEGTFELTLTQALSAGTQVVIDGPTDGVTGVTGTLNQSDSSFNMSGSGDSIYAFTGTRLAPTFLGFITTTSDTAPSSGADLDLSGFSGTDVFAYTGIVAGETLFTDYVSLVQDSGNWTAQGDGSGSQSASFAPPGDFSVVPEPGTYALLSGICALAFVMLRRRS